MDFSKLMEYQNMMQKNIRFEQKISRKIELLTIINHLTAGPKNLVQKEMVIIEANAQGFSEKEIESLIEELIRDNIIYESSPGFLKRR
ncbi:hypothetical protein JXC34_02445 [Candidatus Woesearchaeota archaeon]|nr:hypothetical protein [Candidatus Woesearchaeota archaeon]